ncbi:MAG TPA: hypothetical protein VNU47_03205, partial [Candidatus Paceibacterota bacterium]|nr:hypothetical protein [Candidatus Paceibacterota bacterium]
ELAELCRTYFAIEDLYLATEKQNAERARTESKAKLESAAEKLREYESRQNDVESLKRAEAVRDAERALDRVLEERSALSRELGKVEGALDAAKRRSERMSEVPYVKVPREDLASLKEEVARQADAVAGSEDPSALKAVLSALKAAVAAFFDKYGRPNDDYLAEEEHDVFALQNEQHALQAKDKELVERVEECRNAVLKARENQVAYDEAGREERHRVLELAETRAHEEGNVARFEGRLNEIELMHEELMREKSEVVPLAGRSALSYEPLAALPLEERRTQEERKRALERLKIRLEEAGGSGEDVRTEYLETKQREEFLAKEIEDLTKSAEGLRALITELDTELQKTFSEGLAKVNASFGEFFGLMFGGGGAKLVLEEPSVSEDEDEEEAPKNERLGIEIAVNLPKKRVQSLMQLSGGERALTSIALIFAMSQVNPPPFLILDETDAALDEANSRRYGDMIENLAKRSQLIVITHNRETMGRAGILYGVTMGNDGVSKLLSVKFEEAVAVAK